MEVIVDIYNYVSGAISHGAFNCANELSKWTSVFSQAVFLYWGAALILMLLVGRKLSTFTNPNHPIMSPCFRFIGRISSLIALVLVVVLSLYFFAIYLLVDLGYTTSIDLSGLSFSQKISLGNQVFWQAESYKLFHLAEGVAIALVISLLLVIKVIPELERGEGLYETENLIKKLRKLKTFDPLRYINLKNGCFMGLNLRNQPIYLPWKKITGSHMQVLGESGSGKGVLISLMAYQAILSNETLVYFDPKFDRFSPRLLRVAAIKARKKFHFINLNPNQVPQINLIAGASANEIEELFVSGFDLKAAGTDGDFHRGRDEDAAIYASKLAIEKNARSIPELVEACSLVDSITEQENFWRKLLKLADLEVLATNKGLNLDQAINTGDVIYIVGSTENERVKMLQKMLLVRINQIIKARDRFASHQSVCLVLDEFKHLLSPIALTGLGVIRDFDAHCILAHQSMSDLAACANISKEEAEGVVKDNTSVKIIYKIGDAGYSKELSDNSGVRPIFVEQSSKNVDDDGQAKGGWQEIHTPIIPRDLIPNLPTPADFEDQPPTGVMFGVGKAKVFFVSPIHVNTEMPSPEAAEPLEMKALHSRELI